jgi:hypothetical protein
LNEHYGSSSDAGAAAGWILFFAILGFGFALGIVVGVVLS